MLEKIKKFFGVCNHKWEEKDKFQIGKPNEYNYSKRDIVEIICVLECKNCGRLKNHSVGLYD